MFEKYVERRKKKLLEKAVVKVRELSEKSVEELVEEYVRRNLKINIVYLVVLGILFAVTIGIVYGTDFFLKVHNEIESNIKIVVFLDTLVILSFIWGIYIYTVIWMVLSSMVRETETISRILIAKIVAGEKKK